MGVRLASVGSTAIVNATVVTTTETVVVTTPAINLTLDSALVILFWHIIFTSGVGTTSINVRLRRGTAVSGAQVNVGSAFFVTASAGVLVTGSYTDTPGIVANQQYSVSIGQNAATGNGTVTDVAMVAMVL